MDDDDKILYWFLTREPIIKLGVVTAVIVAIFLIFYIFVSILVALF